MFPKSKPEGKRPKNGGFLLFILAIFLGFIVIQSFGHDHKAKISFAYQLDHLVNLDLVDPQSLVKIPQNDRLVTFSGTFRPELTSTGKERFEYLNLLDQNKNLQREKERIQDDFGDLRKKIIQSAEWFLQITHFPEFTTGLVVISPFFDSSETSYQISLSSVKSYENINLASIKERLSLLPTQGNVEKEKFQKDLLSLIQYFQSPKLGISNGEMKQTLRSLTTNLSSQGSIEVLQKSYLTLSKIAEALVQEKDHVRLVDLRSVRNYREMLDQMTKIDHDLENNAAILSQARAKVGSVQWFYNNQELSTRALEKEDIDVYSHWFLQAKQEWENFSKNHSLSFKVPSQTLTLVLQKKFQSQEPSYSLMGYLPMILIGLLTLFLIYMLFVRQMKGVGASAMNFGKSPARLLTKESNSITFKDVAGADEAKEELQEIVEFLRDPHKFTSLGAKIPKGVLLVGAPGTGKTLIAKAVAGEADRPFFSISGSDFVEMFVGVGASRVRDLFDQAKKQAPCIIFMDEIDAVGRQRGAGIGGGHDEREQTLNQLLVEMDGFDTKEGVILMAATNRPDILDKALLRPGRFDRTVVLELPDVKGRYDILKVHARRIKIDPSIDLMDVAKITPGASGADLENILNEAALLAARHGRTAVTKVEVSEACDKVRFGKERRSLEMDMEEKRSTAFHESGHAIVSLCVEHSDPIDKVTIMPRGFSLGATHFMPKKNRLSFWKKEAEDQLAILMGGRAAEELFINDMSSGARQDISQATKLARAMVCEWGMSDLGLINFDERKEGGEYLGLTSFNQKNYSDETAKKIDEKVSSLLNDAYLRAKKIVGDKKEIVEKLAALLQEFETLDQNDIKEVIAGTFSEEVKRDRLKTAESLQKAKIPPPLPPKEEKSVKDMDKPPLPSQA